MTWRNQLKPASFRGIAFQVEGSTVSGGRRLASHEYAQRDVSWHEDMGRQARSYKIDAFVLGKDYMALRDKLLGVLEQPGPGKLVHPYHGEQQVVVTGFEVQESTDRGGYARFSISFAEAGKQLEPSATVDRLAQVQDKQAAAEKASAKQFTSRWFVAGQTDSVAKSALSKVKKLIASPSLKVDNWGSVRGKPSSPLGALLPERVQSSLVDPEKLSGALQRLMRRSPRPEELLKTTVEYGNAESGEFGASGDSGALSFASGASNASGGSSLAQAGIAQANAIALDTFVVQSATINALTLAVGAPREDAQGRTPNSSSAWTISSLDQQSADAARLKVLRQVDALLFADGQSNPDLGGLIVNAPSTEVAQTLMDLRTSVIQRLVELARGGGTVRSTTPLQTVPAVVLAHALYGDAWYQSDRVDELVARNRIIHPGFVPAGQAITYIDS